MDLDKLLWVVRDTREQKPWLFSHYPDVIVREQKLDEGDYSLFNNGENALYPIVIERKELSDFIACCGKERERFVRELERMAQKLRYLVVIGSLDDIYLENYRSKINPKSVSGSLWSWQIKYNLIPIFVSSEAVGQKVVYDIFKMYLYRLLRKSNV